MPVLPLVAHPSTPCAYVDSITVHVDAADDLLIFSYRAQGDIDRLRLPAPGRCEHRDGLWQHTCCEAFARTGDASSYHEFNFSPSTAWAAYRFEAYRQGMQAIRPDPAPRIVCHRRDGRLDLQVAVPVAALPQSAPAQRAAPMKLALAAVLEDHDGQLCYWALAHPPGKPDFHHRDTFMLTLPQLPGTR